jgi:hypothetical protein
MNFIILLLLHIKDYFSLIKHNIKSSKILLNKNFHKYIKNNYNFWSKIDIQRNYNHFIAVDCTNHSASNLIQNIILAKYFQKIYNYNILVIDSIKNNNRDKIYKSFLVSDIIYLNNFWSFFKNYFIYKKEFNKIKNIDEFLNNNYKKIEIGKISYDDFLRRTFLGTINKINILLKYLYFRCIKNTNDIELILKKFEIKIYLTHELQFNPEAILHQYFLRNEKKVFVRGLGQTEIGLRKFKNYSHRLHNRHSLSKNIFIKMSMMSNNFEKLGFEIIQKRFDNKTDLNDISDLSYTFNPDKKIVNKEYLTKLFLSNKSNPIVYVFANNIYDGVFEKRIYLFRDNYIWLIETLKFLCSNKKVNIFVKEHPTEHYGSKVYDKTKEIVDYFKKNNNNIVLFPNNIHPKSIVESASVIFTDHGTAGLEYSSYGIPTIATGDSSYYRMGFTYEPKNIEQYKNLIKNIHLIKKLNPEQIKKARKFTYIFNELTRVKSSLNSYTYTTFDKNDPDYWNRLSNNLLNFDLNKCSFYKMLQIMLKKKNYNIIDYNKLT